MLMVDTEDTSPAAGAAATDNPPNGGKTTAAGATATAPKQPAQKTTSITVAGVQKAVPTGSPTLDNSDTLPTLNPDIVPDDDSDTDSESVSLHDIGQVLGHQATAVTAIYARVDLATLRAVVRPWPAVRP